MSNFDGSDDNYYPRKDWMKSLKFAEEMLIEKESPIFAVRIYDPKGKLKEDISIEQLVERDKKKNVKGDFNAPV